VFALAQLPVRFWVLLQVLLVPTEYPNVEPLLLPLLLYAKEFQECGIIQTNVITAVPTVENAQTPVHVYKMLLPLPIQAQKLKDVGEVLLMVLHKPVLTPLPLPISELMTSSINLLLPLPPSKVISTMPLDT